MLRIALTGGIASGKSATAATFRELGVPVIDTDRIARDVVAPGTPGLSMLVHAFGPGILGTDGQLDRQHLREMVFSDERTRAKVNGLLHPLILDEVERKLASIDAPYVVVEIPLLAETGLAERYDKVLVIDVPEAIQVARLISRDGMKESDARAALAAQASRAERLQLATDVIENTGTLATLRAGITRLHEHYLAEAKRFASPAERPAE